MRVRDFEAVRLRDDAAVLRVRDFAAVLARDFDFDFDFDLALAVALVCVDAADLAGVVELAGVAAFGASAGFVSVCFGAVSVAMFAPRTRIRDGGASTLAQFLLAQRTPAGGVEQPWPSVALKRSESKQGARPGLTRWLVPSQPR